MERYFCTAAHLMQGTAEERPKPAPGFVLHAKTMGDDPNGLRSRRHGVDEVLGVAVPQHRHGPLRRLQSGDRPACPHPGEVARFGEVAQRDNERAVGDEVEGNERASDDIDGSRGRAGCCRRAQRHSWRVARRTPARLPLRRTRVRPGRCPLEAAGADVVVPYLRGYGATRFVDAATMRSGQQAALAHDLRELIDALGLVRPIVAGYDWGGRAACLVSALWPDRVAGLVTVSGYNVQDIAAAGAPQPPAVEQRLWYQYYLHGERGRLGLSMHRGDYARLLWRAWSPHWSFTEEDFAATRPSFDNPDFVDVVVHSYRHGYGLVAGDPAYEATEQRIAAQPPITVPTIVLDGEHGLVPPRPREQHATRFTSLLDYRRLDAGHNIPQESSHEFARAVVELQSTL